MLLFSPLPLPIPVTPCSLVFSRKEQYLPHSCAMAVLSCIPRCWIIAYHFLWFPVDYISNPECLYTTAFLCLMAFPPSLLLRTRSSFLKVPEIKTSVCFEGRKEEEEPFIQFSWKIKRFPWSFVSCGNPPVWYEFLFCQQSWTKTWRITMHCIKS